VAWQTLSAADGHTLQGYFGFRIGNAAGPAAAIGEAPSAPGESARALTRSEPAAGVILPAPPSHIGIWFSEPLETTYTGARLLDASGTEVAGVAVNVADDDDHELVMTPAAPLPDGAYTVAWQTLSAADGHTLQGYFGFRVGNAAAPAAAIGEAPSAPGESARALTRGLALIGLAAMLAIAPTMLTVLGAAARSAPGLDDALRRPIRRFGLFAIVLALMSNAAALGAQAMATAPDSPLPMAIAQTLAGTRYGQLWLLRLLLLLLCVVMVGVAIWGRQLWRQPALLAATATAIVLPLPYSLLSHAAAQEDGRSVAVAADALHLLGAAIWGGGLIMLAVTVPPALRMLTPQSRSDALRTVLHRFSAIGLAAWGVLSLTGLYSAWLQVGTVRALTETPYGLSLLFKGALLLPVLFLAAFHLILGWRGVRGANARRVIMTLVFEAVLVVVVLVVVGKLIGQEPAREVMTSRTPSAIDVPLQFATDDGTREALLTISPGAAGINEFTLEVAGAPLPEDSEGVLRFAYPSRDIGVQELRLPAVGTNRFRVEGSELSLPGEWNIDVIVRRIGAFSWASTMTLWLAGTPPPAAQPNPAPHFAPAGIAGLIALAVGMSALAAALVSRGSAAGRRLGVAATGAIALATGVVVLVGARIPSPALAAPPVVTSMAPVAAKPSPVMASPAMASHMEEHEHHMMASASPAALPTTGTPVQGSGLQVTIGAEPDRPGPTEVVVEIVGDDGSPLTGARVAVVSEMTAMAEMSRAETRATEIKPGRYVAESVPLGMPGEWRLAVRVSPKSQPTQVIPFVVAVPG
jgi:copper transport protein